MRLPRFFGKKRGHRRTVSEVWGSVGDALFHLALLGAGLVFGGLLVSGVAVPEWRINHDFVATNCSVVGKGLARRSAVADGRPVTTWQPCLLLRYATPRGERESWTFIGAVGNDRTAALEGLGESALGAELTGWYDPLAPDTIVLKRGYNWWMWALALLLPGALVAFGGNGLLRSARNWGKSEERRALAGTGGDGRTAAGRTSDHPGIPSYEDMVNSPGTILRYRLPAATAETWTSLGFGLFAVLWNAILVVLLANAGVDLLGGRIDWLLLVVIVPFVGVGVAGVVMFVRRLVLAAAVGTTQLEISAHPLVPGGRYEILVAQGGAGAFRSLEASLELEEQATFRQGTDTRTDRVVVWRAPLASWRELQLAPGTRFEGRADLVLPPTGMHSFASEHNAVRWQVVVRGRPARWPAFTRTFPLLVVPSARLGPETVA